MYFILREDAMKQYKGQLSLEDIFGIDLKAPVPTGTNKEPAAGTRQNTVRTEDIRPAPVQDVKPSKEEPEESSSLTGINEPEHIAGDMPPFLEKIMGVVLKKNLYPGDRERIETSILNTGTGLTAYVMVVKAFSDSWTDEWTMCHDGSAVKFTRGFIKVRLPEGKTENVAWGPVYDEICSLVRNSKWLTDKERTQDREAKESAKGRRKIW